MPGIVRELASFEGRDLRVEMFTIGGCTMERHLEQADCRDLIERGGYDFVVLQDQSLHPALIGTPDDQGIAGHMEAIVAHIRTHNPKVSPYIEMTWGRRNGYTERKFDYDFLRSYASMQERIRVNTLAEAEAVGAAAYRSASHGAACAPNGPTSSSTPPTVRTPPTPAPTWRRP